VNDSGPIVLVVDDDTSFRQAVGRMLTLEGLTVELFASAEELTQRRPLDGPGCILLDLHLPRLQGLALQARLSAQGITTPIIFLSGNGDIPSTVSAIKAGAVDFLTKPVEKALLMGTVMQAFARDREQRAALVKKREALLRVQSLTPREMQVMHEVVRGLLNKQIAAELKTSEATIKVHRARVMQKLRVSSVAELVRLSEEALTR